MEAGFLHLWGRGAGAKPDLSPDLKNKKPASSSLPRHAELEKMLAYKAQNRYSRFLASVHQKADYTGREMSGSTSDGIPHSI
jgi:hypothetical protein